MTGDHHDDCSAAREAVSDARREAAAAMARLAKAAVAYADVRIADESAAGPASDVLKPHRPKPGEFVADELSMILREQPYQVRCLLARTRRLANDLPTVWQAFQRGDLDHEQIWMIDRIARQVTEAATLAAIENQVIDAAQTRTPKQLRVWLLRLVVQLEPLAFEERHRRALAERRVTVVQGADGMGYVTGEVSAQDAAAIDGMLAATARSLGADDPRTDQQRRSDLFADLLLGRLAYDDTDNNVEEPNMRASNLWRAQSRAGWRSKTLTPTPVNCSAPSCNASTPTANLSGNPSMPSPTAQPHRHPGWCGGPSTAPHRCRGATCQPARRERGARRARRPLRIRSRGDAARAHRRRHQPRHP